MITIQTPDGAAEAHLALPRPVDEGTQPATRESGPGPWPGVLLFVDAFGLRPVIEQMAQRIADWGYVVLAPNVFHRDGSVAELDPGDLSTDEGRAAAWEQVAPRVAALTPDLSGPDTKAWLDALQSLPEVAEGPVGVTGYCMGARLATRAAVDFPDRVAAVGGWHGGGLVTDAPDSPHRGLERARARFSYGHADNDRSMPAEAVAELGRTLEAAGLDHVNVVFPGAPHGYTMGDTSNYDHEAAERHYIALRQLLAETFRH